MLEAVLAVSPSRGQVYEACCALQALGNRLDEWLETGVGEGDEGGMLNVPCSSLADYLALCRGVLAPKLGSIMDPVALEHLVRTVVEAFVATLPGRADGTQSAAPCFVHVVRGGAAADSCALPGVVLPGDLLLPGAQRLLAECCQASGEQASNVRVVVLTEALDIRANRQSQQPSAAAAGRQGATLVCERTGNDDEEGCAEDLELQAIITELESLLASFDGLWLLACQKGIHSVIQEWLTSRGVVALQRLGGARVAAVAREAGCTTLESVSVARDLEVASSLGSFRTELKELQGHILLHVRDEAKGHAAMTVVLCSATEAVCEHLKTAVESALRLMRSTSEQLPHALPGAGACELYLYKAITDWVSACPGHTAVQGIIFDNAAHALLVLARRASLAKYQELGSDLAQRNLEETCTSLHGHRLPSATPTRTPGDVLVLDSLPCKMTLYQRAIATTIHLLKIAYM